MALGRDKEMEALILSPPGCLDLPRPLLQSHRRRWQTGSGQLPISLQDSSQLQTLVEHVILIKPSLNTLVRERPWQRGLATSTWDRMNE